MRILTKSILCPNCASHETRRSRRKGLMERTLFAALFVHPYRCESCDQRYYRLRLPVHTEAKHPRHAA
jgi:transposase-like protein